MNLCNEFHNDMDFTLTINLFKRLSFTILMNLIIGMNCITVMGNGYLDGDEFTKVIYFYQGEGFQGVYEFS